MWIELHDSAREHPKVLKLAKRLDIDPGSALGYVTSLWCWTLRMAPDGDLSSFDDEDVSLGAQWPASRDGRDARTFIAAMVAVRLLDRCEHGLVVHDWQEYSGSLKSAERARNYRARKRTVTLPSRDGNAQSRDITQTDRPTDRQTRQTDRPDTAPRASLAALEQVITSPQSPTVIAIPLVNGTEHPVTEADISEWSAAFPAVDVVQTLRNVREWNLSRPRNRKTARGVRAHITGWLAREQDRGGSRSPQRSLPAQRALVSKQDQSMDAAFAAVEAFNATR